MRKISIPWRRSLYPILLLLILSPALALSATEQLNHAPDCANAAASPSSLWPANHKFTEIGITGTTDPDNDPLHIAVQCIYQDEEL